MRYFLVAGAILTGVALGGSAAGKTTAAAEPADTVLFDGKSLDQFTALGDAKWSLKDGYMEATNGGMSFLVSKGIYADFDLKLDFWVSPDANSGVFIRCQDASHITDTNCYEVNIFDQRPDQTYRTGAITHIAAPRVKIDTGNRWSSYEIIAKGGHLVVKLDGKVTVDVEDGTHAMGRIALQYGNGTIRFRNIRLTAE